VFFPENEGFDMEMKGGGGRRRRRIGWW